MYIYSFFFSDTSWHTEIKEPSLSCYPVLDRRRILGSIPFHRTLALCEMQTASFRFWIRVTVPIFYEDNPYTMSSLQYISKYVSTCLFLRSHTANVFFSNKQAKIEHIVLSFLNLWNLVVVPFAELILTWPRFSSSLTARNKWFPSQSIVHDLKKKHHSFQLTYTHQAPGSSSGLHLK